MGSEASGWSFGGPGASPLGSARGGGLDCVLGLTSRYGGVQRGGRAGAKLSACADGHRPGRQQEGRRMAGRRRSQWSCSAALHLNAFLSIF